MKKQKPGVKTTEFWIVAFAVAANAFVSSGLLVSTHPAVKVAAMIATILGALGYGKLRTETKNKTADAEISRNKLQAAAHLRSRVPQPHRGPNA